MDAIADALLPACESSIKSLSQFLTTLHSINALGRLKEKADVVAAFAVIVSFAPFVTPSPPPITIDDDARPERFEQKAEALRHDRLVVMEERQDDTTPPVETCWQISGLCGALLNYSEQGWTRLSLTETEILKLTLNEMISRFIRIPKACLALSGLWTLCDDIDLRLDK